MSDPDYPYYPVTFDVVMHDHIKGTSTHHRYPDRMPALPGRIVHYSDGLGTYDEEGNRTHRLFIVHWNLRRIELLHAFYPEPADAD